MHTERYNVIVATTLLIGFLISSTANCECDPHSTVGCYPQAKELSCFGNDPDTLKESWTDCMRECDGRPKVCYYKLHVEPYSTMGPACGECPRNKTACSDPQCITADGVERGVFVYNRKLPGPAIQVCKGDVVVVDVINADGHRSTSIHWHGMKQVNTPHSDGVPMVTQCPINPGETFRYRFNAIDPGSYFYHSHSGVQKIDGLSGPLVVRNQKSEDLNGELYDYDLFQHVVYIQDWIHLSADEKVPGLRNGPDSGSMPKSFLINGKGIYIGSTRDPQNLISMVGNPSQPPISEFIVKKGKRYRFRMIGSTCLACTVKLTIQSHNMKVIHADGGGPINPTTVDGITFNSGDRFDVIVEANQNIDSYWILVRGQGSCSNAMNLALLRYEGGNKIPSSNDPLEVPRGITLNPSNPTCETKEEMCVSKLTAPVPVPPHIFHPRPFRLILQFGFHFYSKEELFQSKTCDPYFEPAVPLLVRAQINGITNKFASSPLLSQYHEIPDSAFCSRNCHEKHLDCSCLNVYKIPLNSLVEFIVVDTASHSKDGLTHPFHLHGHNFYIFKEGVFPNGMVQDLPGLLNWLDTNPMSNKTYAIQKDSIGIPSGGYAVIRFVADNPGFWIFHCHFTLHLDLGMSAILQVGELHDMTPTPNGFPKCGNFMPPFHF